MGNEHVLRCAQWNGSVCVSGVCQCPICGGEKWCYATRHRDEPEPPCLTCQKRMKQEKRDA